MFDLRENTEVNQDKNPHETTRWLQTKNQVTTSKIVAMTEHGKYGAVGYNSYNDDNDKMATPPSHTTVEDSLSKGLLSLSITDRNAMEEEIHGVRCLGVTKETPALLQHSLSEFNKELMCIKNSPNRIPRATASTKWSNRKRTSKHSQGIPVDVLRNVIDTTTFTETTHTTTQTQTNHGCYLNDPDVRLRFLRCENFDPKAAARRFLKFFELARDVFGDFVAERPPVLSDFMESTEQGGRGRRYQQHAKKAFSNSRIQYLPFRDRSGRRVKVGVGECNSELDLILRIKINLLLDWIASEDVETQQKGVVIVVWPSDPPNPTSRNSNNNNSMANSSASSSGSESEGESNWEGFLRPKLSKNDLANHNRYYHAQPIRIAAIHWCSQDKPIYRVLNSLYYFSLDSKSQSRYKVHYGKISSQIKTDHCSFKRSVINVDVFILLGFPPKPCWLRLFVSINESFCLFLLSPSNYR